MARPEGSRNHYPSRREQRLRLDQLREQADAGSELACAALAFLAEVRQLQKRESVIHHDQPG